MHTECSKSFSHNNSLKRHSLFHSGEKPQRCPQCNFSCNDASNLKVHVKKHIEDKLHQCNQCEYTTIQPSNLKRHKKSHSGEKPNRCTTCEYSCITTGELKVHMIRKHEVGYRIHFLTNFCIFHRHHFRKCKRAPSFCENRSDSIVTKISEVITEICST